jgi:predicted nucleic acid-binding protein
MRQRGRPQLPRGVHSFAGEVPLPDAVLLDTSYVVEALIVSQPLHAVALDFLVRLAEAGVRVRYSTMLELELAETAFQLGLKENHPRDWRRFRHDGRARPRAARLMAGVREAWAAVGDNFDCERVAIEDVVADVGGLMAQYGLGSYDAVHAATALRADPVAIVTTDVAFASLPESTAILTDPSRVARCRQLRARRAGT